MRACLIAACTLWVIGCTMPVDSKCDSICSKQLRCYSQGIRSPYFDKADCIADCAANTRDPEAKKLVDAISTCMKTSTSCEQTIACGRRYTLPPLSSKCRELCQRDVEVCPASPVKSVERATDSCMSECVARARSDRLTLMAEFKCLGNKECTGFRSCIAETE